MRTLVLSVVDTPAFEWFVLVLIFASSITLCFEDIYLDSNITLKRLLYWTNFVFSMIFVVEMVLKWMALGFTRYFTSFWTILDFIIVFVSLSTIEKRVVSEVTNRNDFSFAGVCVFLANRRKWKPKSVALAANASGTAAAQSNIPLAGHADRCKRINVCHTIHFQCAIGMFSVLVDFLNHGRPIFWR